MATASAASLLAALAFAAGAWSVAAQNPPHPPPGLTAQQAKVDHPRGKVPRQTGGRPIRGATAGSASANPLCGNCNPPLLFTQGSPVIGGLSGQPGHVTVTPVYWAPSGYSFTSSYKAVINGYLQNVAAASDQSTNVFSVDTQYYDQSKTAGAPQRHIQYAVQAGQEIDDSTAFPTQGGTSGCTANAGFTACVTDSALQAELMAVLPGFGLTIDDSHMYVVFFPSAVETCLSAGTAGATVSCSTNDYCAYHSGTGSTPHLVYANEPYPDLAHCTDPVNGPQAPNGDSEADSQVSLVSHEINEAITDWAGAWADSAGYENGDECGYVYGTPLGGAAGAFYNQVVGTGHYYTQDEFSNEDFANGVGDQAGSGATVPGCVQRDEAPSAIIASAAANVTAGTSIAFDATGSADPDSSGPLAYSWAWGDGTTPGTGLQPSHAFAAAGTYTVRLTVADADGWSASASTAVTVTAPVNTPCAAVSTSTDKASPQSAGGTVTLTSVASGCSNPRYEFWELTPGAGTYIKVQPYSATPTYGWTTSPSAVGLYHFIVFVRDATSAGTASNSVASWDAYTSLTYQLNPPVPTPCPAATVSTAPASPQVPGTTVAITASATGCPNPRYEFWMLSPGAGSYIKVQPYSSVATFSWSTSAYVPGLYRFIVFVRDASSAGTSSNAAARWDAYTSLAFQLTSNPNVCTGVAQTTTPSGAAAAGTTVTVSGKASGCPSALFEFWMLAPGTQTWVKVKAYSSTASYSWSTIGAAKGVYQWIIFSRDTSSAGISSNSVARWDAYAQFTYTIQ